MQFHQDGYRSGDPRAAHLEDALPPPVPPRPLPRAVDVLVVGCGPTGLLLAAQLARVGGIAVAIADQKPGPLEVGQADGIACRSMEMFHAFGFARRIEEEAYWVNETTFWRPDPDRAEHVTRSGRIWDVEEGLSEFPHVILNQARVHDHLLEVMRLSPSRLLPHYGRRLDELVLPGRDDEEAVATFTRLDEGHEDEVEVVRARYVVGTDGARSTVRRAMGRPLSGDAANQAWGVMDVLARTDFPDIRRKAVVHSAREGNLLVIPREGGHMVRLYIELAELDESERVHDRGIDLDELVAAARRILTPYTLEVEQVAWWSVYEIGQRLTDRYDDGREQPRVFIAGDACHTHSPKAGQGMNVSMRDSYNLGWKLAGVLAGRYDPGLLRTYSEERRAVAQELIDFDRAFAAMFSAPPKRSDDDPEGVDPAEFQRYFQQKGRFTAGVATRYAPSVLTGDGTHQRLATGFEVGMRFHSAPVVRLADTKPMHLGHVHDADGRWRLYLFADGATPDAADSRLAALCDVLAHDPGSPIVRTRREGDAVDAVVDVRAILQQHAREVEVGQLPGLLRPLTGSLALVDHQKVFCPEPSTDVFDLRGVDRGGAMVLVRPDQHVATVLPLTAHDELAAFLGRVLRSA